MNIAGTEINLPHRAYEIYVSGCSPPHCEGCHNPELWDFGVGELWEKSIPNIIDKALKMKACGLIDYIWLLGGEPLDQDKAELEKLLNTLSKTEIPIVLWTHYEKLPCSIIPYVHYVKIGAYEAGGIPYNEPILGIKLANTHQKVFQVRYKK